MLYVDTGVLTEWYLPEAESAASLAERHCASLGARSMDIPHVASAEHLDCSQFITGDRRQAQLAEAIGLPLVFHQHAE